MREPKPWYRSSNDGWYVEIAGKQIRLAKGESNKTEAYQEFYKLMAGTKGTVKSMAAAVVADLYLDHSKKEHKPESYELHKYYLQSFCNKYGHIQSSDLIPFHLTAWVDAHPKWKGSRRHALSVVKSAFSWVKEQGLISTHPFAEVKLPKSGKRKRVLTEAERKAILDAIPDEQFRNFVFAMQETGCRPGEVRTITAAQVNLEVGVWIFEQHKTDKKTDDARVVYLTPAMVELCRVLMLSHPEGPLFRGPRLDRPYSSNAIRCRFRRLREKLPQLAGVVAYSYRHSFCTDALVKGVGIAQVAELLGHKSTVMVSKVYSKLAQQVEHLRDAAKQATS